MSTGWDPSSPYQPHPPYPEAVAYAVAMTRARVNVPGLLLIVVGVINLLLGGYLIVNGAFIAVSPLADIQFQEAIDQAQRQNPNAFGGAPPTVALMKGVAYAMCFGGGGVSVLVSVLLLLAGIRMRALQSYGLALTGSILAAIPCISCSSCFGLGEVAGIWALVVLIDPSVRMAFHAAALPPGQYPMPQPQQPIQPTNPTPEPPNDNVQPGGQQ
jgi:hypothetical protein